MIATPVHGAAVTGSAATRSGSAADDTPELSPGGPLSNGVARLAWGIVLQAVNWGLKAYRREVTAEVPLYGELHRFIPLLAHWRGFSVAEIAVSHRPRAVGRSRYGWSRVLRGIM